VEASRNEGVGKQAWRRRAPALPIKAAHQSPGRPVSV
jgi:hypothetical protein